MTKKKAQQPHDPKDTADYSHPALHEERKQQDRDTHAHGLDRIPPGFIKHRHGKKPPLEGETAALLVIKTADGYSTSGPRYVLDEEWQVPAKDMGAIVAYQRAVGVPPRRQRLRG